MNKKTFTVELGTDSLNNIDATEVHLALMKYFVAFVYIDVTEAAQQSLLQTRPNCGGEKYVEYLDGTRVNCEVCGGTGQVLEACR